jgi:hypothetical protein
MDTSAKVSSIFICLEFLSLFLDFQDISEEVLSEINYYKVHKSLRTGYSINDQHILYPRDRVHYYHPKNILFNLCPTSFIFVSEETAVIKVEWTFIHIKTINCDDNEIIRIMTDSMSNSMKAIIFQDLKGCYQLAYKDAHYWNLSNSDSRAVYNYTKLKGFSSLIHQVVNNQLSPKLIFYYDWQYR